MDIANALKSALPWIGAAATGNIPALVGLAATAVSGALGKPVDPQADAIAQAVTSATPEQYVALKKAEQDFQVQMQQMGYKQVVDLEQIAANDRASARAREVAVKDYTPMALAFLVTFGFFGVLCFMLMYGVPKEGGDALMVMLGSLGTAWAGVIAYYFGSSAGSARKTELLKG